VQANEPSFTGVRHQLWLTILVVATIAFSLVFACAAPFAAFGAAAALTLSRRDALLVTVALWLANQLTGYAILHYPWTTNSVAWGPAIGIAAVLGTMAAQWTVQRLVGARDVVQALAALLAAFAVYEVAIFAVSVTLLGGLEMYAPSIVGQVFVTNVAALVGLYGLNRLGTAFGLRRRVDVRVSAQVSRSA
jgi:peptidoglycan/LPS O-acetylase OafA/YrhL